MDVEALDRRRARGSWRTASPARSTCARAVRADFVVQPVERAGDRPLRRIAAYLAGLDEMRVALRDGRMRLKAVTQVHRSINGRRRL